MGQYDHDGTVRWDSKMGQYDGAVRWDSMIGQ